MPKSTKRTQTQSAALLRDVRVAEGLVRRLTNRQRRVQIVRLLDTWKKQLSKSLKKEQRPPRRTPKSKRRPPKKNAGTRAQAEPPDDDNDVDHDGDDGVGVPVASRWQRFVLQRDMTLHNDVGGTTVQALQVYERIDSGADPEDREIRLWAQGMFNMFVDGPWSMHEGVVEGNCIRVVFPRDTYSGMPTHLDLERPRKPRIAGPWRLLRPDRRPIGIFVLKEIGEITGSALTLLETTLERR